MLLAAWLLIAYGLVLFVEFGWVAVADREPEALILALTLPSVTVAVGVIAFLRPFIEA